MSTAFGDSVARLLVRVSTRQQPHIRRHCPRCATERHFASSGKFRVNAQRKILDAWLIYLCTDCDYRWNLPIHERKPVKALDPIELEALMRNDAALAERHAAAACSVSSDVAIDLAFQTAITEETAAIEMAITAAASIRLDRLLALVLGLRRAEIQNLHDGSMLSIVPPVRKALRRPASDGMTIHLDLAGCPSHLALRCRRHLAEALSTPAPDRPD